MTFFFRKHTNFVPSATCFLDDSSVTYKVVVEIETKEYLKKVDPYWNSSDEEDEIHVDLGEVLEATYVESGGEKKEKKKKSCNLQWKWWRGWKWWRRAGS